MDELLNKPLDEVPVVVLDTETTGLYPNIGHRVVEIGAMRLEPESKGKWQFAEEFNQLIDPGRRMDPGASRVNGIYDQDLAGKPSFSSVIDELLTLLEGALVVAHNARFDAGFLAMEMYIHNLRYPDQERPILPNPWLCTMLLARQLFHFGRNNLSNVARMMGVRTGQAHRALNDVYMTAEVMKRMVRELDSAHFMSVGDYLNAQGGVILAPPQPRVDLPFSIRKALEEKRPLRIRYMSATTKTERVIDPLYPTTNNGVDYLIAHCRLRQDQRTFRIDRILSVDLLSI